MSTSTVVRCQESAYSSRLLKGLMKLKNMSNFLDITFIVEGEKFRAHKCILVARNEYFSAMLRNDFSEKSKDEITLNGVSAYAFDKILTFIYTGSLECSEDHLIQVFQAVDFFQISYLKQQLCIQMSENVTITKSNCLEYLNIALTYSLCELEIKCRLSVCHHISTLYKEESFTKLPADVIVKILKDESLLCAEIEVVQAICFWLEKNEPVFDRKKELMSCIRYGLLSSDDVDLLKVKSGILSEDITEELRRGILSFQQDKQRSDNNGIPDVMMCSRSRNFLIIIGGYKILDPYNHKPRSSLYMINSDSAITKTVKMPVGMSRPAVVNIGNSLYIMGGRNDSHPASCSRQYCSGHNSTNVYQYDVLNDKWTSLAPMPTARNNHQAVLDGNYILVGGGLSDNYGNIEGVDQYDIIRDEWQVLPKIPILMDHPLFCLVAGAVYALGIKEKSVYEHQMGWKCLDP